MLEPLLQDGFTIMTSDDIKNFKENEIVLEKKWNDVVSDYKQLNLDVQDLKPSETKVVQETTEGDKIQDSTQDLNEAESKQKHVQGMKMQMQQDLVQLADQNGLIIILGVSFIFAAFILLLLLGYS